METPLQLFKSNTNIKTSVIPPKSATLKQTLMTKEKRGIVVTLT